MNDSKKPRKRPISIPADETMTTKCEECHIPKCETADGKFRTIYRAFGVARIATRVCSDRADCVKRSKYVRAF